RHRESGGMWGSRIRRFCEPTTATARQTHERAVDRPWREYDFYSDQNECREDYCHTSEITGERYADDTRCAPPARCRECVEGSTGDSPPWRACHKQADSDPPLRTTEQGREKGQPESGDNGH